MANDISDNRLDDAPIRTPDPHDKQRRAFLTKVGVAAAGVAAAFVTVPAIAFLLGLRKSPSSWRSLGHMDDFKIGETVEVTFTDPSPLPWSGVTAKTAAWLRRKNENEFVAFAIYCTHLGCPVRWIPTANLFMCPCHGGVFYGDGTVASGPPPQPLSTYPVRINQGLVEIQTSPVPITTG
jgi:menaquinol-cytochrome c reductase iron-sulfur subunit